MYWLASGLMIVLAVALFMLQTASRRSRFLPTIDGVFVQVNSTTCAA